MRMMPIVTLYRALALSILGLGFVVSVNADDDLNRVRFDRDIRPLLSDRCFHCHGPDTEQRQADLRLDRKDDAFAPRDGQPALTAGNLDQSSVWARISTTDESERMPPVDSNKKLTPAEMELIKRWIEQGAEWTDH
ncbi:MAG: hypothetical protein KDA62_03830, partial [Planctomycetales bacterium]|nr:hypothetical protein [Planctomycetales bacterium]